MARDETLARGCGSGEGFVRFYQWTLPTISFGRNEPARGHYPDEATLRARGYDVVRRPTGGRVVLHHRELTYSVLAPISAFSSLRDAYRAINAGLVSGISRLGVPVQSAPSAPALPPDAGPCFRAPAEGEVMLHGRKLVGSAQVRVGDVFLQHGSILLHDDQHLLDSLRAESPAPESVSDPEAWVRVAGEATGDAKGATGEAMGAVGETVVAVGKARGADLGARVRATLGVGADASGGVDRPATLGAALDPIPPIETIISAIEHGLRESLGDEGGVAPTDWRTATDEGSLAVSTLSERLAHYRSPEWTWRR